MNDSSKNDVSLFKYLAYLGVLLVLILITVWIGVMVFLPPVSGALPSASINTCANNLSILGKYLDLYKQRTGSYPPIDGGEETDDWANFLRDKWSDRISPSLFVCPFKVEYEVNGVPGRGGSYVFANSKNEKCFPDGKFTYDLSPKTPIAGDAYDPDSNIGNHGQISSHKVNILLFDGTVRRVDPRSDRLGKKAYLEGCLYDNE